MMKLTKDILQLLGASTMMTALMLPAQPQPPPPPTNTRTEVLKVASRLVELSDLLLTDADLHWLHEELKRDGVGISFTWYRDGGDGPWITMSVGGQREGGE